MMDNIFVSYHKVIIQSNEMTVTLIKKDLIFADRNIRRIASPNSHFGLCRPYSLNRTILNMFDIKGTFI